MGTIYRNGVPFIGGGGGGTSTDVELTQAEYDALPASKLTDDVNYFITDGSPTVPGVISAEGVQYNNNLNVKQALDINANWISEAVIDIDDLKTRVTNNENDIAENTSDISAIENNLKDLVIARVLAIKTTDYRQGMTLSPEVPSGYKFLCYVHTGSEGFVMQYPIYLANPLSPWGWAFTNANNIPSSSSGNLYFEFTYLCIRE